MPPPLPAAHERRDKQLKRLESLLGPELARRAVEAAQGSFDPEATLSALERIGPALPSAGGAWDWLVAICRASDFLPRLIGSRPSLVRWLGGSRTLGQEKSLGRYCREAEAAVRYCPADDAEGLWRRLRRYKYRELLRITLRDLVLKTRMDELGRETSHLAEALIRAALGAVERPLCERYGLPEVPGFCVLGMGKLGGEDLNYSSDVDLIYLYRAGGRTAGGSGRAIESVEYFTKVGEALTRALAAVTPEGFCYRVDLNLRPQGRGGAMVLSLPAALIYYENFGRTWERAAMLKARVVGGDAELGQEFLEGIRPFVWRRSQDLAVVEDLREMRSQIDLRGQASADDVKLGRGGIREVEFFANALQLLHGGRIAGLRERNTLKALRKLEANGNLSAPDADGLEEAYLFLRRVENRLQMVDERQTQTLPTTERERLRLARSLDYEDWEALWGELSRHREKVARSFHTLLGQTAREDVPDEPLLALALDSDAPEDERIRALEQRGFVSPPRALQALARLSRIPGSPFSTLGGGGGMQAVRLLAEVARSPDPDQALLLFSDFICNISAPRGYLDLLTGRPQTARRLLNLFGQSDFLSRYFLRHPELLDTLVQSDFQEVHKAPERIRDELAGRVTRHDDPEERLAAMRRYKNEEVLRVGLNDISGELDVPEVARQLSAVADGVLDQALYLSQAEQRSRYGEPRNGARMESLAVIGMGKLGGFELGYHSDLDLIFVYSGPVSAETTGGSRGVISHHEYFAKVVQRLCTFLEMQLREGYLYKVDTRLRPSGNKGALVVSQEAFREHHEKRAQLWERQALLKARWVGGDEALFRRIDTEVLLPLVYQRPLPEGAAAEIARLRLRMEREIAQETHEQLNPKTGHGGLVDVEFAAQYLQLVHGGRHPQVKTANTLDAIDRLSAAGCLSSTAAQVLRSGYLFHRRVENRLRLVHGQSISHLPTSGRPLQLLARRLGYVGADPGMEFLSAYRACTAQVREVYARILQAKD